MEKNLLNITYPICNDGRARNSPIDGQRQPGDSIRCKVHLHKIEPVFSSDSSVRNSGVVISAGRIIAPNASITSTVSCTWGPGGVGGGAIALPSL